MRNFLELRRLLKVEETLRAEVVIRQYGLLNPIDWDKDCEDELLRMNQLWNRLVEIEHAFREGSSALIMSDPEVENIHRQLTSLYDTRSSLIEERKNLRRVNRRKVETLELDEHIQELSLKIADLRGGAASARKTAREKARERMRALEGKRRTSVKLARQESGLWWGNYNAVVKAYERGRQGALRNGGQMQFKRYDGTGRFVNQIQGGMTLAELFGATHSQLSVGNLPDGAWTHPSRGERRRLQRTNLTATVFVRSGERRTVTWPLVMHRPIPDDCLIKEVVVTRRKLGPSWRWQVTFTCTRSVDAQCDRKSRGRVVAVDVGWRRIPEGIRVATVVQNDGTPARFVTLPSDIVDGFALVETLQSRRDIMRNDIIAWLKSLKWSAAPEPLATQLLALQTETSVSAARVASLAIIWRDYQGWAPEEYHRLEKWRLGDKRLWLWELNQREKLIARRNDLYRRLASDIVKNADTIILNRLEIAKMSRLLSPRGQENPLPAAARRYRTIVAPSYFMKWVEIQAKKKGITIAVHDTVNWACHACGVITKPLKPDDLLQTCVHCGATWDQDLNACHVMLNTFNRDKGIEAKSSAQ